MSVQPHNMWLQLAVLEAEELREKAVKDRLSNTPVVLACLREHQPCTSMFIVETTGIPHVNVGAIIGTGVRAKRLRFTLEKVAGHARRVKFYSEVI